MAQVAGVPLGFDGGFGFTFGGTVTTYQPSGKEWMELGAGQNGGYVEVYNKIGENVVDLCADEYGNGVVGTWNRKGKGRTLQSGPSIIEQHSRWH